MLLKPQVSFSIRGAIEKSKLEDDDGCFHLRLKGCKSQSLFKSMTGPLIFGTVSKGGKEENCSQAFWEKRSFSGKGVLLTRQ